jgi:hypothetical protein
MENLRMRALLKLRKSLRDEGLFPTARKVFHYTIDISFRRLNQRRNFRVMDRMFKSSPSRREVFSFIYKKNVWFMRETKSGPSSTLRDTEITRKHIQSIVTDFSIRSIYDAPCGDFNWMRLIVTNSQVEYLGADIVPDLIDYNQAKFQTGRVKFMVSDIVVDSFPSADLWICRDCLPHFSNKDVLSALEKFCESKIKFVLTTTHPNNPKKNQNVDIHTGQFRELDLFSDPFNFPVAAVKYRFLDCRPSDPDPREMILLSRDDILIALPKMRERIAIV